jgi:hypothetical protein
VIIRSVVIMSCIFHKSMRFLFGLDWIGLDWIGLDWTGLDWIGLDWTGLDSVPQSLLIELATILHLYEDTIGNLSKL